LLRTPHFAAAESLHTTPDFHFATDVHRHRVGVQSMNSNVSRVIIAVFSIRRLLFLWAGILARRMHPQFTRQGFPVLVTHTMKKWGLRLLSVERSPCP
jgi:hypothetical protein